MACKSFGSLEPFKTFQSCKKLFFFYIAQALQWMQKSLWSNSFLEEFPRVPFGKLLLTIYFFFRRGLSVTNFRAPELKSEFSAGAGFWGGYRMPALEISWIRPITPSGGPGTVWRFDCIRTRLQGLWLEFESLISSSVAQETNPCSVISKAKWNKRRWITKQHEIRPLRTVLPRKTQLAIKSSLQIPSVYKVRFEARKSKIISPAHLKDR